jgi:hypothetical protein
MRAIRDKLLSVVGIGNATLSADNTPAAIDLRGFDAADIEFAIGIGGITFDGTNKVEYRRRRCRR